MPWSVRSRGQTVLSVFLLRVQAAAWVVAGMVLGNPALLFKSHVSMTLLLVVKHVPTLFLSHKLHPVAH